MNDPRLGLLRWVHTVIYVVMATSIFVVLYAGVTGSSGAWLWVCLGLLGVEVVAFTAAGMKCPLTDVVQRYAGGAPISDTYFPERLTRHTLAVFGPLLLLGVALLVIRTWLAA